VKGTAAVLVLVVLGVSACAGGHRTGPLRHSLATTGGHRAVPAGTVRHLTTAGTATGAKLALNYNCIPSTSLMPRAQATHSRWIRIAIYWNELEAVNGVYNRRYLNEITNCLYSAHRHGLRVLAVFISTPGWANNNRGRHAPPTYDSTYATAIGYLARTYPASSTGGIDAFEIWNEANTTSFWTGTIRQYETLLAHAYNAVKAYSRAEVVLAGTAHIDERWDRAILANGYGRYFDVLAVHPYPNKPTNTDVPDVFNGPANAPNTLDRLRSDLNHYGYPDKPIWLTEIGWSTHYIGDSAQAAVLRNMYRYIRNSGCYACASITLAFWYALLDTSGGYDGGLSLLNDNLTPKPAYPAMVDLPRETTSHTALP
jgi:cellulase (glycosyl hydrolase family 5)